MIEPGPILLSPEPGPTLLSLLRASVPPLLYHYTSVTGFEGIVTSKSIWASAAQFLNDTKEYKLAMDIARRHIAAVQEREVLNRDRAKLLGYLHDQCERMEDLEVCIFSLSVEGDLLSQWRGYCPPNGGYSIGFVGADLREVMTAQGGILAPCVYEIDLQERLVAEALAPVLGRLPAAMPDHEAEIELLSDRFATDLFAQLILVAPLIKHHSFVEEGEWRLIWIPGRSRRVDVKYRAGRGIFVPYVALALEDRGARAHIGEVIVGPMPHQQAALRALTGFLAECALLAGEVRLSQVPYRTW
jgi:hypothetical protein